MDLYHLELIDREYNPEILNILRSAPINTENLTISFDRQPDFFLLPQIKYHPSYYYGFFRLEELKGFFGIGYHNAMVNGSCETVFHLRDFYVSHDARGKGFAFKVAEKFYKEICNQPGIGYAIIMAGNKPSLHYIGYRNAAFPHIPYSQIINQLDVRNIILTWPVRNSRDYLVRKADLQDIPEIVALLNTEHKERLFGNLYDETTFQNYLSKRPGLTISNYYLAYDKKGNPCGVCSAWDCSAFKQTRVYRYGKQFAAAKALYKSLSLLFNMTPLPGPGECFKDFIISDYAVKNREPVIMNALLRYIYNDFRKRGFQIMIWGSSSDDALLKASDSFFYKSVISNIVLFSPNPAMLASDSIRKNLPYIDLSCL